MILFFKKIDMCLLGVILYCLQPTNLYAEVTSPGDHREVEENTKVDVERKVSSILNRYCSEACKIVSIHVRRILEQRNAARSEQDHKRYSYNYAYFSNPRLCVFTFHALRRVYQLLSLLL